MSMGASIRALVASSETMQLTNQSDLDYERPTSIVVIGLSGSGKTSLINALRSSELLRDGRVVIPTRFITRPMRRNDSTIENIHVMTEEFDERRKSGEINVHWQRRLGPDRVEQYGFTQPAAGLVVYSCNDAIYSSSAKLMPANFLVGAFTVAICAPRELREQRVRLRSPDLWDNDEGPYRLSSQADDASCQAQLTIENAGSLGPVTRDFLNLIKMLSN